MPEGAHRRILDPTFEVSVERRVDATLRTFRIPVALLEELEALKHGAAA